MSEIKEFFLNLKSEIYKNAGPFTLSVHVEYCKKMESLVLTFGVFLNSISKGVSENFF